MKTRAQRLLNRREHKPNGFLYSLLYHLVVKTINRKLHTSFTFKAHPGENGKPFILVSNHASRVDYLFTVPACYPHKLNFVVGYNEFYNFPTNILLMIMQVIPKKNFTPDIHTIRSIKRVLADGGNICIMPEGMSSITGMAQPVMPGIGKLLKSAKVDVYYTKVSGGYMTYTKHCLDERKGRIDVVVDQMFSPEQIASLTEEQIEDTMNRLLAHDDYIWNSEAKVKFDGKGQMAKALDTLLYMCPKCGAMHQMKCEGNHMTCTACGNAVTIDETYTLSAAEGSTCPANVTDWVIMEREQAAKDVSQPGFSFSEHVRVGILPDRLPLWIGHTSKICGDGQLTISAEGLHFKGSIDYKGKEELDFTIPCSALPTFGMCTDISRFYTFLGGRFIEFYPDSRDALRWDHLVEEMHRHLGGKWQNTAYRHCE